MITKAFFPSFHLISWNSDTLFEQKYCPCTQDLKAFISFGLTLHGGNEAININGTSIKAQVLCFLSQIYPQGLWDSSEPAENTGSSDTWNPGSPNAHPTQLHTVSHQDTALLRRETLHYIWGNTLHRQQQAQGAACDLMGLCTKKLRICMHPNSHCISLLRSFWKCQPSSFGPYIHTCKHEEDNRSIHRRNKHLYSFSLRT